MGLSFMQAPHCSADAFILMPRTRRGFATLLNQQSRASAAASGCAPVNHSAGCKVRLLEAPVANPHR